MSDETGSGHAPGDQPPVKKAVSLDTLLASMVKSVPFQTEAIGEIQVREKTMTMQSALVQRLKELGQADDLAVARVYMGCTSTRPKQDNERTGAGYKPLPEEDAARLTDQDVTRFAPFFFDKIAHKDIGGKDPVAALAEHARQENTEAITSAKKWAEEMSNLVKGSSVMAHWPDLRQMLGPSARLSEVMEGVQKNLAPLTDINRVLEDAIRPFKGIDLDKLGAPPQFGPIEPEFTAPRLDFERFHIDPEKTPAGRAAASAEALEETATQIAGDVTGMVKQVGTMTDLLGKVATHAEEQIRAAEQQVQTAERHAKKAGRLAILAIIVAFLLPVLLWVVDLPDRALQAEREGRMLELMYEQNRTLRESIDRAMVVEQEQRDQIESQRRAAADDRARIEAIERNQQEAATASPNPEE